MAKKSTEEAAPVYGGKVNVTLLKNHTHAGKDYKAGEVIEIEEHHLAFLEAAGVVETKT